MVPLFSLRAFYFGATVKFSSLINGTFMGVRALVGHGLVSVPSACDSVTLFLFS